MTGLLAALVTAGLTAAPADASTHTGGTTGAAPLVARTGPRVGAVTDLCAELEAAVQQVQAQIEQHNAQPNQFTIPDQAAQAAAYNAEATALNAQEEAAIASYEECVEAASVLGDDDNTTLDVNAPDAQVKQALQNAKDKIPNSWTPPPAPAEGENWRVPKSSPPRKLYDLLRANNPPRLGADDVLGGETRPVAGAPDPAYSGRVVGTNKRGLSAVSADHIVPIARIINMPGFMQLTPENMYVVTRAPVNYQWATYKANLSKSSRSVSGMSGITGSWRNQQDTLEKQVLDALQDCINQLLRSQGLTPPSG